MCYTLPPEELSKRGIPPVAPAPELNGYVLAELRGMGRRLKLPHDGIPTEGAWGYPTIGGIDRAKGHAVLPDTWKARIELVDGGYLLLGVEGGCHLMIRTDGNTLDDGPRFQVADLTRGPMGFPDLQGPTMDTHGDYLTAAELEALWPEAYATPFYVELKRLLLRAVGQR